MPFKGKGLALPLLSTRQIALSQEHLVVVLVVSKKFREESFSTLLGHRRS